MHDTVRVNVFQRLRNLQHDAEGAFRRELSLLIQNLPEEPAIDPLHCQVELTVVSIRKDLHHARVIQLFADLLLALEAVVEDRMASISG